MVKNIEAFHSLDITSAKPISVPTEIVEVEMSESNLFDGYAKAFVNEAYRVNPLRAEQVKLTVGEMLSYMKYLLVKRIETVQMNCPEFRKLKVLYIPVWIQYNLSMIGEVNIREKGLKLVPTIADAETISYAEAVAISDKIGAFESDLQIVHDAMPRDITGDVDVMSTAMIDGYVRAIDKVDHVAATYVTAFMGMKLKEEAAFKVLYRVQYDDIEFIATALTAQKGLY